MATRTSPTKPGTKKLSEVARHIARPTGIVSTGWPKVERTCKTKLGVDFDEWQKGAGRLILSKREDGKLAATVGGVGMSLPRQVGKTYLLAGLIFALCIDMPGLLVIWTAHHLKTSGETFLAMQAFADRSKVKPYVKNVYTGSGDEEVRFHNGSRILFGARERGFGRGIPGVDVLVMDEAQILSDKAMENMLATLNTSQFGLHLYIGTPPKPDDNSESFERMRTEALEAPDGFTEDLVWIECGADESANPEDPKQWAKANPSFPHRTPIEAFLRLKKKLTELGFLREGLGIWPRSGGGLISAKIWEGLADKESTPIDPVSFGVYVNRDRTQAAIGVAAFREDGLVHVGIVPAVRDEAVETLPGTAWIPYRVKELFDQWSPCATVIDERSAAGSLITTIEGHGVEVLTTTATDMAKACGNFYDAVVDQELGTDGKPGRIRHHGAPNLTASVTAGKKRDLGDSWAWDRKDPNSDITQLVAVTLALHGLLERETPGVSVYEDEGLMVV